MAVAQHKRSMGTSRSNRLGGCCLRRGSFGGVLLEALQ